jgi:hypothetical protein
LAQQYFHKGIEITEEFYQIDQAILYTEKAINEGYETIFEEPPVQPIMPFQGLIICENSTE